MIRNLIKTGKWIVLLLMIFFMVSCSREGEQEEAPKNVAGKQEVVIWSYYETEQQKKGLDWMIQRFNNSQDKYEARWEYHGPASEFTKQLSIGVTEEQLPDLVLIDNPDMRRYVELGIFEDITDFVKQSFELTEFYPEVIGSVEYGNKYYGMPFCCNNVGLVYNKQMLEAAGVIPPTSWEELRAAAEALTQDGRYGFAMSAITKEQAAFQVLPWILSTGETMKTLGGAGTQKALEFLKTLIEDGSMSKDCINWSQVDVARQFVAGNCAMMENGPWALPLLEEAGIQYETVMLPVDKGNLTVSGGENFGVIRGKNVDGALALIQYYYQEDVMIPVNEQMYSLPPVKAMAVKFQEKNPVYHVFVEQMDRCISRSAYPEWPIITGELSDALCQVIVGGKTPGEAASSIRKIIPD